jgi:hypothetical protein
VEGYQRLYDAAAAAYANGSNAVHRDTYVVLDNPYKGVKGGWQVRGQRAHLQGGG